MTVNCDTSAQCHLLDQWVAALTRVPAVEVIWLEGSFVDDRANPWSDIDLRLGIADAAYEALWEGDRAPLLEGLGDYLLLWERGFVRALTAEGVLVELGACRSSELDGLELYEWRFLLDRRPAGTPRFQKLPERTTAETWPGPPVTPEDVRNRTLFILHNMAIVAQDFWSGEVCAQAFTLDYLRGELFQVLYQRTGIRFAKRNKELSKIFPVEFVEDLKGTFTRDGESALDPAALAAAQLRTFAVLGKHLRALGEQVGGGFEAEWWERMEARVREDLGQWAR